MQTATDLKPGKLITLRNREWVVLPSNDKDILNVKPLGGTADESTSIYLPFGFKNEKIEEYRFPMPQAKDVGDFESARLLYNAIRLSFREASGPFRSIAKLNFTPRAYQMVPLIMALKQEYPIRLFIADDVGIGKTIESLMVVREMIDRGVIKRFAIICLPHLCDQWAKELMEKFGIEATIFTSGNAAKLRRQAPITEDPLHYYPYQIISIDYIKSVQNAAHFVDGCPEMVIVDEIHTCADDGTGKRQLRHKLIQKIAQKPNQHLLLLSATPHSGKPDQFKSILGLLNEKFLYLDLSNSSEADRKELAKYYVQRRREDIKSWTGKNVKQETSFPTRESYELDYNLSASYLEIQKEIMKLASLIVKDGANKKSRISYWTALGLVRGVMSSPKAGMAMLEKRSELFIEDDEFVDVSINQEDIDNPVIEDDYNLGNDNLNTELITKETINDSHWAKLKELSKKLNDIDLKNEDAKVNELVRVIKEWMKSDHYPIVYCRYIKTAEYLHTKLSTIFDNKISVNLITSQDPEEVRRDKVIELTHQTKKILIATDCMSEGINLQEAFNAVIHYDLPWNPNRLEQREGRVDRYGQSSSTIKTGLLYGKNNPMDGVVLNVLLLKAREIKRAIGISVPFPENNQSIMETVTKAILLKQGDDKIVQLSLFSDDEISKASETVDKAYKKIEDIEKVSRSIFTQHSIKAQDIDNDLDEAIRLIGDMKSVESFVIMGLRKLGGQVQETSLGYKLYKTGLPSSFHHLFPSEEMLVCFDTPIPQGYRYLPRNHEIVDHLCQTLIAEATDLEEKPQRKVTNVSVIKTSSVKELTITVLLLRARNVIESAATKHQIVAEELMLWGYKGAPEDNNFINEEQCLELLQSLPEAEVPMAQRRDMMELAIEDIANNTEMINDIARSRAINLVEAHDRFRVAVKGKQYQVVEPILPMDVMGIFILMPK